MIHQKIASTRLEDSTVRLTMDVYTQAPDDLDVAAAQQLQRALRSAS